jgi:hypothetical protein
LTVNRRSAKEVERYQSIIKCSSSFIQSIDSVERDGGTQKRKEKGNNNAKKKEKRDDDFTTGRLFKSFQFEMRDICPVLGRSSPIAIRRVIISSRIFSQEKRKRGICLDSFFLSSSFSPLFVILFKVLNPLNWEETNENRDRE